MAADRRRPAMADTATAEKIIRNFPTNPMVIITALSFAMFRRASVCLLFENYSKFPNTCTSNTLGHISKFCFYSFIPQNTWCKCKLCRPWSDCSWRSSLIRVCTVCIYSILPGVRSLRTFNVTNLHNIFLLVNITVGHLLKTRAYHYYYFHFVISLWWWQWWFGVLHPFQCHLSNSETKEGR